MRCFSKQTSLSASRWRCVNRRSLKQSHKRQKSRARRRHKKGGHAYLKKPTICRYCGGIIRLVPAADVYGSSTERLGMQNEYLYQCQNCNARVGCHKGTMRPLGDVANEILRLKRIEAHQVFDAYWQKMHISRTKAYVREKVI